MSYAILKPKFDGRNYVGDIPCHDGRVAVLEGTPEERGWFKVVEAVGYGIKEVDVPPGNYYWEHYNEIVSGRKTPAELGYGEPPSDEPSEPPKKKATVKRKKKLSVVETKAKPEGNDSTGA